MYRLFTYMISVKNIHMNQGNGGLVNMPVPWVSYSYMFSIGFQVVSQRDLNQLPVPFTPIWFSEKWDVVSSNMRFPFILGAQFSAEP